ncbi:MAG: phosphate/phosphite/phosphonate ABC transporter substrate-binding protein [Bdellovibrio sp.]|nr:phosphate/phosphite/phosphonate ABC transporter substrate-binding protein [Bdellovibrio sp.]
MKRLIFGLLTLFVFATAQGADTANSETTPPAITIGVIPGGNPENLRQQGLSLAKELQAKLNIPVNIYISKNYVGLVEAMKTKKVDFAFFSSSTYVFAEQQAQAKVLLKTVWHEPFYYSVIVTPQQSSIKKLKDLKGKKIAFVDDKSSSGYLYPQVALRKEGLADKDFKEAVFTGNHQASIQFLEAKKVDAAAVFSDDEQGTQGAWVKFGMDKKAKYRILWKSAPIPNDPFCVRQDFYDQYPKTTHTLMFALIDIVGSSPDKKAYSEILGSHDLMPATSKQYDPVREMVKALNLKLKP